MNSMLQFFLTGAPVTPKRMVLYPYTITHTGINLNRAIAWRNMIRDGRITEIQKEKFDDDIVEKGLLCYKWKDYTLYRRGDILWSQ